MTEITLEKLCINTQKDQIIARLILQKCIMYVEHTEKWLDGFISKNELDHVMTYAHPSDCQVFREVWDELEGYYNEGIIK